MRSSLLELSSQEDGRAQGGGVITKIWLPAQFVSAFEHYKEAVPSLTQLVNEIENAFRQIDDNNILAGGISSASLADGVGQVASGSYTGDGVTANRIVTLAFTPRFVVVLRTDATPITFESISVLGTTYLWIRDATGALTSSTANFQGGTTNGIKLGTSATGTSNALGVVYAWCAYK